MVSYKQGNFHFLLVFRCWWLWWTTCIHVIAAYHSLKPGDKLNSTTQLCSENGKYSIGFSKFNDKSYLRIYANGQASQEDWAVWIANRNQAVDTDSAVLLLHYSGVLKIESNDSEPIILYSSPQPANNTMATLWDTGNFVLQQLHPNGTKSMLWQSFDYPMDELLPGMKLGVNFKTGRNWSLVSWLADDNPSLGAFSLEWETKGKELIIKRRGQLCWTSGELRNKEFLHNTLHDCLKRR
ncbi:G-type lectin S-receptor serine/threonine-protein kinase [Spatholobus suberectus]|nr:G-type lectin S-receptor serine/threonine-protein kinase [Spatholobus suberectus]